LSGPLHFVTGKGGVGKSTVAAAIAIAAARRGARVLAVELGQPGGLGRMLADEPTVKVACFEGSAALGEYLTRRVRLGPFSRVILGHSIYQAFVGAAPGLRELMAVGKIRDELILRKRWDVVVVDAGASGHALEHLRMPAAASRAFGAGLVHREAERNADLLRDPDACAVHVVATAEEMPVREAVQLVASLRALAIPIGAIFVNQCRPVAPPGIDAVIEGLGGLSGALVRVARRARSWERIQEREIAELEADTGEPAVRLPRVWTPPAPALAAVVGEAAL
jgi:anion-transporting  ArsA/GET3 family ATPase